MKLKKKVCLPSLNAKAYDFSMNTTSPRSPNAETVKTKPIEVFMLIELNKILKKIEVALVTLKAVECKKSSEKVYSIS